MYVCVQVSMCVQLENIYIDVQKQRNETEKRKYGVDGVDGCVLVFVAGFLIESCSLDIKAPYLIWLTFTIRHTLFYTLGEEDSLQKDRNRQAPVTVTERK